jgi:peptide/nickel transport system permease protein
MRRLRHDIGFGVGAGLLLILVLLAAFAPWLSPYDPVTMRLPEALQAPGPRHLMGTDNFGRDILSRILWGARPSLGVGVVAMFVATVGGTVVGLAAGYAGGWVDSLTSWAVDVLMALPGILLALALVAIMGTGLFNVLLAVGIASVPGFVRLVRGSTLSAKEELYVEAARCQGATAPRILFRHILPNVLSSVLVWASLGLAGMILSAAGLSFLGLGAQPPTAEWGVMVSAGRGFLRQAWWMAAFPGGAIMLAVLAINLMGDAVRDAIDPRLRS